MHSLPSDCSLRSDPIAIAGVPHAAQDTCSYSDGVLAYYEIKRFVKPEDLKTDPVAKAAYARYNGSSWVGFDTPETHKHKMCFARYKQLAGVFFWDTDLDDGQELIKAARGNYDHADCGGFTLPSCAAGGDATGVVAL